MSDFKPIETQEQFDEMIRERLERAEKKYEEKYAGYISPDDLAGRTKELNDKIIELSNSLGSANTKASEDAERIKELEAKTKSYETASVKSRIAHEVGIPYELADRLGGDTEEAIRKDAEALKPFVTQKAMAPLRNPESPDAGSGDATKDSLKKLVQNLRKE